MISLYRRTVYNAYIIRSRNEQHDMLPYSWASYVYDILRGLPNMRDEENIKARSDMWNIIMDRYEIK